MLVSHISEGTESIARQVKFRDNLIMRNNYSRRDRQLRESRTPSILKKSQLLRNNCSQFMQVTLDPLSKTHTSTLRGSPASWRTGRKGSARPMKSSKSGFLLSSKDFQPSIRPSYGKA